MPWRSISAQVRSRHDGAAESQRHPQALVRTIEVDGGELQLTVVRRHAVERADAAHVHRERAVRHGHPLGLAGGAGGVDQVRQLIRVRCARGIGGGLGVQGQGVETQGLHARGQREAIKQMRLRDHPAHAAVGLHEGQAIGRVAGVQRHIGATGLEHGHQRGQHVGAARGGDAHARFGPHAPSDQVVGQAVSARVEFGVAPHGLAHEQGWCVRALAGLGLDQGVHGHEILGYVGLRCAPLREERLFGRVHQRHVGQGLVRRVGEGGEQALVMLAKARDGGRLEQRRGVGEARAQAPTGVFDRVQRQLELREALVELEGLDGQARQLRQRAQVLALVVVQHLEQRRLTQHALGLQGLDQLLEGQVLVVLCAARRIDGLGQQLAQRHAAVQARAPHLRVDEEAHQRLRLGPLAVGDRHADADVRQAGVAVQHGLPCGQQHGEHRRAFGLGAALQACGEVIGQIEGVARGRVGGHGLARVIGGELQHGRLVAIVRELRRPVGELAGFFSGGQPVALPLGVVGVLDGRADGVGVCLG